MVSRNSKDKIVVACECHDRKLLFLRNEALPLQLRKCNCIC